MISINLYFSLITFHFYIQKRHFKGSDNYEKLKKNQTYKSVHLNKYFQNRQFLLFFFTKKNKKR